MLPTAYLLGVSPSLASLPQVSGRGLQNAACGKYGAIKL